MFLRGSSSLPNMMLRKPSDRSLRAAASALIDARMPNCGTTAVLRAAVGTSNDCNLVDSQDLAKKILVCGVCK